MKLIKYCYIFLCLISISIFASNKQSSKAGQIKSGQIKSVQTYYSLASDAFEKLDWTKVIDNSFFIIKNFPDSPFTKEVLFFLGVAYFNLKDFEASNKYFTRYLKDDFNPKYFEEVMHYKFSIATNFKNGAKKRMFGWKNGPKILEASEDALSLFDEIIASMPMHDLAAKSLFAKGQLLFEDEEYKDSISIFEQLIERFEKHELAIDSHIEVGKVYLKRTTYKSQDLDLLDLAQLNLEKLKKNYPVEAQKIKELEKIVFEMQQRFAQGFLDMARFYENTNKKDAAKMYYNKILKDFPNTDASKIALKRFDKLNAN